MFRVASYNIRKAIGLDRVRHPERVLDVLREIDADVVALQESDRRFGERDSALPIEMIARHTGYQPLDLRKRPASLGWHGNAILVRAGIETLACGHIDLPNLEPRGAVFGEVRIAGQEVRIVGMHLDLSGIRRRGQARAIMASLGRRSPMPTVLMGDLNEWSLHGGCLRDFGRTFHIAPTAPSFHSRRPIARLDRIMIDRGSRLVACGVHHSARSRVASDHLPVWADIAPEPGVAISPRPL